MNKLTTLFLTATLTAASAVAAPASKTPAGSRTLIVYFSRTGENYSVGTIKEGNTAILAKMIAEQTGGTLFEVKPAKQYPADYKTTCDLAKKELNEGARPAILGDVRDFAAYDTVFIGYPVWWGDLPMAMYTFIGKHNFAGKVVIPFNTHEGSEQGSSISGLTKACKGAKLLKGIAIPGHTAQNDHAGARASITEWLKGIGIAK